MADFIHKYTRRKRNHDYRKPGTYHIIWKKQPSAPDFGELSGSPTIPPGEEGCACIVLSTLGKAIQRSFYELQYKYPFLQVYQYCIMPDHVHLLLRVKSSTKAHLSYYMGQWKRIVENLYNAKLRYEHCPNPVPGASLQKYDHPTVKTIEIFQPNYTDKPLYAFQNLDIWYKYIRENPHRLAMRKLRPDFFRRVRKIEIEGESMQAYGNLFLLRNPYKEAVVVRSFYDDIKREELYNIWMDAIEKGGVLVSAFVAADEKEMRRIAEEKDAPVILITDEPFPELYKPATHNFAQCERGKLLILAPAELWPEARYRERCQRMNRLAAAIANSYSKDNS